MPLDVRIPLLAGQGVTPIDPQAMQRGMASAYELQGMRQQQAVNQLKLEDAQRQEFERQNLGQAIRGTMVTDPVTGQQRPNLSAGLARAYTTSRDPLTLFKVEQDYTKGQAERAKTALEAQKVQLEQQQKGLEFGGQVAQGIEDRIAAGADPQVAWQWGLETMQRAGLPTQGVTPTYDANMLAGWKGQALQIKDKLSADQKVVDQQLRELELKETQKRTTLEQRRTGLEERRTRVQEEDVDVRRADIQERRESRQQERESTRQQRLGERENELRDEFNTLTKDYRTVGEAYGRIQTAGKDPSPAGDMSLIFGYMKLLDPTSAVRETEQATVENARGVPERVRALWNRLKSGEKLTETQRQDYLERSELLYGQATKDYEKQRTQYQGLARRYGVDPANVTLDYQSTAPGRQGARATPPPVSARSPHAGVPVEDMTLEQLRAERDFLRANPQ